MPFFLIVIGRILRYEPKIAVWFVVGMVCFHTVLRVFGVSWYDILSTWGYFFLGTITANIILKLKARNKARDAAIEAEWQAAWDADDDMRNGK